MNLSKLADVVMVPTRIWEVLVSNFDLRHWNNWIKFCMAFLSQSSRVSGWNFEVGHGLLSHLFQLFCSLFTLTTTLCV